MVNRRGSRSVTPVESECARGSRSAVFKMIDVAVVWDDPCLFERFWAYASRVPDLAVREASVTALLDGIEQRPDVVLIEVAPRDGGEPVADIRRLRRAGYRVLALTKSADPYLTAALLGTGACVLLGKNQTVAAIAAAIRAPGPGPGPGPNRQLRRAAHSTLPVRSRQLIDGSRPVAGIPATARPPSAGGGRAVNGTSAVNGAPPRRASAGTSGTPLRPRLSEREKSVLIAYTSGMTLDAVARRVGVRPSTAKTYLERVKAKYREIGRPAYTKTELRQRAREDGCSIPSASPQAGA